MAAENLGDLYIRMGLSLSDLETDFLSAERTVTENVRRLNRQSELIRIRSEIEIAGLDESADAERILQIRTDALNQQMEIQRDRVRILTAEWRSLTAAHGENAAITQRATIRLERERLALANLERESRRLSETSGETNNAFGELSDLLPEMPTKLGAAQMALGALTAGIGAAGAATKELLDEFRELQNQSYELNMSFPDTRNFLREMRLAGGDIGDYEGFIRGITDAYVKGEYDDPEFIALRKYGAEIVDATGRLKEFKDISEEVYQAWLKADEAGEGIEFLQLVGGESGVRDAIQLFQRLKEAREDAAKISKAGIDEEQLHKLDRSMNLVTEQASELKAALGDIFVPTAQAAAERFFNVLRDGTEYLVENKEALQKWQFVTSEIFDTVSDKVGGFTDKIAEIAKTPKGTTGNAEVDKTMANLGWRYQEFNQQKPWGVNTSWEDFDKASKSYGIFGYEAKRAEEKYKAFKGELKDATTVAGKMAQGLAALTEAQKKNGEALSEYGSKRVQQFKDELEDLKIELEFGDDDYRKSLAKQDLWKNRESVYKNYLSDEERAVIDEVDKLRRQLIDKEHFEKIAEAIQSNFDNAADVEYEMTHSAFEKQIRDIELWEQAQLEKRAVGEETADIIAAAAAKEAQAFEDEMDRIRGKLQSLDDKIFDIDHSQYEKDLRRIQQDYLKQAQEYQELGIFTPELKAKLDYLYGRQKQDIDKRANESRAKGGDYTKTPEGVMQPYGGVMLINGEQLIDPGLMSAQRQTINLLADENQVRGQLLKNLDAAAQAEVEKIEAAKEIVAVQNGLPVQASANAIVNSRYPGVPVVDAPTMIMGDRVAQISTDDAKKIVEQYLEEHPQQSAYRQISEMPTQELKNFGATIEQADPLRELSESTRDAANVQKAFIDGVKDFPPDYFKNLADNAKAVSEMQGLLTKSTMDLIEAQGKLVDELKNLPGINSSRDISTNDGRLNDGFLKLSTQDVRREISDIPPQKQIAPKDSGFKFGFDWDVVSGFSGIGLAALKLAQAAGAIAPHPAIKAGAMILGAGLGAGFGVGSYDETTAPYKDYDERLKAMPADVDLSTLETSLSGIGENVQSILQSIQDTRAQENDRLQELFGALPNIEEYVKSVLLEMQGEEADTDLSEYFSVVPKISEDVQSILQAMQATKEIPNNPALQQLQMPEPNAALVDYLTPLNNIDGKLQSILQATQMQETISFETVITPLNSINALVGNILTALTNRQPPQITVAPNNSIDLGGAYVFDNALKQELVNDITKSIVDEVTAAVKQATSQSNYNYGA